MAHAADVIESALRLPPRERGDLAVRLIESLDAEVDEGAESAWDAEIARRLRELDSGAVEPIPWAKARATILGLDDAPGEA